VGQHDVVVGEGAVAVLALELVLAGVSLGMNLSVGGVDNLICVTVDTSVDLRQSLQNL
jgi:hypothetical protein